MRRTLSKFVLPLAVILTPLSHAGESVMQPSYAVVTRAVEFADLDLTNSTAVATLYQRIKSAAAEVCGPVNAREIEAFWHARRCEQRAISQAVNDVGSPGLTSLHQKTTNRMEFAMVR